MYIYRTDDVFQLTDKYTMNELCAVIMAVGSFRIGKDPENESFV